jgi:hypothetical protein
MGRAFRITTAQLLSFQGGVDANGRPGLLLRVRLVRERILRGIGSLRLGDTRTTLECSGVDVSVPKVEFALYLDRLEKRPGIKQQPVNRSPMFQPSPLGQGLQIFHERRIRRRETLAAKQVAADDSKVDIGQTIDQSCAADDGACDPGARRLPIESRFPPAGMDVNGTAIGGIPSSQFLPLRTVDDVVGEGLAYRKNADRGH